MQEKVSKSTTVAKNTLYMFFRMLLVAAVSFYTSRVVLTVLGVDDFGIYNIVGSIVVFLSFFKNALTNATYRYIAYELGKQDKERLRNLFSMSLNVHLILAFSLLVIMEIVGVWFLNNKLNIPVDRIYAANWVFQFSLVTFCIEIIKTPYNSMIIANERMSFYAYTSIIEAAFKLGIVYLLLVSNFDKLILYSILLASISLIMFLWYKFYNNKHFDATHYVCYWDKKMLKELSVYSGWSIVVNAADVSVSQCISIFLNLFYGVAANAAMGIANQVNSLLGQFLNTFSTSYNPQIIKSYANGEYDYFMKLIFSTSKLSFFLMFSIAFPVMLNIEYLLKVWLVNPPEMAGTFLICIACYSLFDSFSVPLWNAVHATGNLKVHQILMSLIKIINIPLGYVLLKAGFPAYSILVLYAALNAISSFVRIVYLKHLINLDVSKYFRDVFLKMISVIAICVPITLAIYNSINMPLLKLLVSTSCYLLIYIFSVYLIGLDNAEKNLLIRIIKNVCGNNNPIRNRK